MDQLVASPVLFSPPLTSAPFSRNCPRPPHQVELGISTRNLQLLIPTKALKTYNNNDGTG